MINKPTKDLPKGGKDPAIFPPQASPNQKINRCINKQAIRQGLRQNDQKLQHSSTR